MTAPIDISDHTTDSFNPGDLFSRSFGESGGVEFGLTGKRIERIGIAVAVAVVIAVGVWYYAKRGAK